MFDRMTDAMPGDARFGLQAAVFFVSVVLFWAILWGWLGSLAGRGKNAAVAGALLAILLGPLGVLVACFLDQRPTCPVCGNRLNGRPVLCGGCRTSLTWTGRVAAIAQPPLR